MLKHITNIDFPQLLAEFKTFPNQPIISSILNGDNNKQICMLPSSRAIMLIEPACDDPFIFLAGVIDSNDVDAIINQLKNFEYPMVYCDPLYHSLFLSKGWDFNLRAQLLYKQPEIKQFNNSKNWKIKPIDNMELFEQCIWFKKIIAKNNSVDLFFKERKGYVLCHGQSVISEAYLEYEARCNYAEISVATQKAYRGQGAGVYITSYVINECLKLKLIPLWSCQLNNRPSLKTALKAGFQLDRYYIQMVPEVGNTLSPKLEEWIIENSPLDWSS